MIKVAVNGYGTIGKRVADAIKLQSDMMLIGIGKLHPDYEAFIAKKKGYNIYTSENSIQDFKKSGIEVAGTIDDMIREADIIVDATPDGVGAKNKPLYMKYGKHAIFQGGEEPEVADVSFSALCNYDEATNKQTVRVVSCNTTSLLRIICTINNKVTKINKVRATIVRRAADPKEVKKGPINALIPNPASIPSHHARDVNSVIRDLDIITMAVVAPTTLMHMHFLNLTLSSEVKKEDVISALLDTPRITLVRGGSKIGSTAEILEVSRDLGRYRNDLYEVVVFEDSIYSKGNELFLMYAVHQEAIVVPENIDAIRASFNLMNAQDSINITNNTLNILKGYLI